MPLIESLGQTEGVFRGEGGFSLEGGEIVELRGDLFGRLLVLCDGPRFTLTAVSDLSGQVLVPDALGASVGIGFVFLEFEIDPFAFVFSCSDAEGPVNLGIGA